METMGQTEQFQPSLILGIETSCDETAVAIVSRELEGHVKIHSNLVLSQIDEHAQFGGVVPEIAARSHLSALDHLIEKAMKEASIEFRNLSAVAVTAGPGLMGGLLVGLMSAKGICAATGLPLICINHLEGHALTARLTDSVKFPYLLLLVSGGHTQILVVNGLGEYRRWASTIDDALGEAFDKTAKLLSLGFPGGPNVEEAAKKGNPSRFDFPQPLRGKDTLNMSFSGLKTAIRLTAEKHAPLSDADIADICASFQETIGKILVDRLERAMARFVDVNNLVGKNLVIAGGVAANLNLRKRIEELCNKHDWELTAPPLKLCGDNAAMIAWAGLEHFEAGNLSSMDFAPRSRWPLDTSVEVLIGHGKRGAKA